MITETEVKNICCIGAGYVGGPTCAVIAQHCQDIKVNVVDINADRIEQWNSGPLPINEAGLDAIISRTRNKNLFFTTDIEAAISEADLVFISVNTPTKRFGRGSGAAADLSSVEGAAKSILKFSKKDQIIVEKSTVPCGTADALMKLLSVDDKVHFEVLSNPEFLAEGTAIENLNNPDRVLIGSTDTAEGHKARKSLANIYTHWVAKDRICLLNIWSSELAKLAANAMLAQRISSINTLSSICELNGADIKEVAKAVGLDMRIGSKFLKAGIGFGGSCFQKDILNLSYLAESLKLTNVASYWKSVIEVNQNQKHRFIDKIVEEMFGTVYDKKLTLFGFAYKKGTGDTRESPAIDVVGQLLEEGAILNIFDPLVEPNQVISDLIEHGYAMTPTSLAKRLNFCSSPVLACVDSSAIVVCTEWDEFKALNYEEIYSKMRKPAYLFDGRIILNHSEIKRIGFKCFCIGKGTFY